MRAAWRQALVPATARRRLGALISLAAVATLAALAARTDWRALSQPLEALRPEGFGVAVALALGVELVKTLRWQLLLGAPAAALPRLLALVFTGRLLNALAPLRAGDVWRVAAAAYGEERPLVAAGGSVVVEKALDGATLAALGGVLLWTFSPTALLVALLAVALLAALALLPRLERRLGRGRLRRWVAALAYLRDGRLLAAVVALTLAGLALGTLVNLAVLDALGLPRSLQAGLIMLVAGYAAGLIPSGPAQLGVFELAVATPLAAAGLSYPSAMAAALTLHLALLAMLAVGGLLALGVGLVSRPVRERAQETATPGARSSSDAEVPRS